MCSKTFKNIVNPNPFDKNALANPVNSGSPSKMVYRAANGQDPLKAQGPVTFKSVLDEGNLMGINPKKAATDNTAEQLEAERQARISKNVADINSAFTGRESQYQKYADALRTKYTDDLNRQYADAGRNLKFELAGAGLTGGSVAKDQGAELSRQMSEGTITAEQQVGAQEAALRSADEQSRLNLISLAQAGGDIGNAATQAGNMLKANYDANANKINALGDVFGSTAATYKAMQEARNLRRGLASSQEQIYGAGIGKPFGGK